MLRTTPARIKYDKKRRREANAMNSHVLPQENGLATRLQYAGIMLTSDASADAFRFTLATRQTLCSQ